MSPPSRRWAGGSSTQRAGISAARAREGVADARDPAGEVHERVRGLDGRVDQVEGVERPAECDKVPRRGAGQGDPPRDPRDILHAVEGRAQLRARAPVADQRPHAALARVDLCELAKRGAEPVAEQAPSHGGAAVARARARAEEHAQQRPVELAPACRADRPLDLQRPQADRVHDAPPRVALPARRLQVGEGGQPARRPGVAPGVTHGRLGLLEVSDHGPRRGKGGVALGEPEPVESRGAERLGDRLDRLVEAELPGRARGAGDAQRVEREPHALGRFVGVDLGVEQLAHAPTGQLVADALGLAIQDGERPGRGLDDGEPGPHPRAGLDERDRAQAVGGRVVEQPVVDERAAGHDAGHGAVHDTLGVLGVLDLIGDGDA